MAHFWTQIASSHREYMGVHLRIRDIQEHNSNPNPQKAGISASKAPIQSGADESRSWGIGTHNGSQSPLLASAGAALRHQDANCRTAVEEMTFGCSGQTNNDQFRSCVPQFGDLEI